MKHTFATRQSLDKALDWITDAPKNDGVIDTLCIRPAEGKRQFVESMQVNPEEGIVGDRWIRKTWMYLDDGSPDPRLQMCIISHRVLETVRVSPTMMYPGDNMVVDMDLSETNLPAGQQLTIGNAVIEVSDVFNTACPKWRERYGTESLVWINEPLNRSLRLRGVLAKVVVAGEISIADTVRKV